MVNVLDTPIEPLPDIVDHTADWDNTNSTADDVMHSDAFVYSTDQKWTLALLKLLDDMYAPDFI